MLTSSASDRSAPRRLARALRRAPLAALAAGLLLSGLGAAIAASTPAAAVTTAPAQGWTTTEAPLPADAGTGATNPEVYTASSVCPAANACVSVGWYYDTSDHSWGLIETQNGTSWTETEAPQPANAGTGANQGFWFGSEGCGILAPCRAVSCPTTTSCVAVGQYLDSDGYPEPVVDTLAGGSWTSAEGVLPADAATDTSSDHPDDDLYSVSCPSASSCVAVGTYTNTSGVHLGYVSTLAGTTWTATAAPLPSGADTTGDVSQLLGVSCSSASSCAAAGEYSAGGDTYGLLLTLANGTWTPTQAPEPSNASTSGEFASLFQVDCSSSSLCAAVGLYDETSSDSGLIDTWNGTTWTGLQAPLPADASSNQEGSLTAVSCPSSTSCVAVGSYETSGSFTAGLIDTLSGGTWTGTSAPVPSDASSGSDQVSVLYEVACSTAASCITVGFYGQGSSVVDTGVIDTLALGTWSASAAPVPSNAKASGGFASTARTVACAAPVACTVTGWYDDTAGNTQGFLDTYTGVQGYWLVASDGGIFNYGNTVFQGSTGSLKLNAPVVGMAPTTDGAGYWEVATDGGIFSYGDALFHGSMGGKPLNKPIVGMAATPDGAGYWEVASDGGIFAFGDATFYGSMGGKPLNKPIVGIAATPDGHGYWEVASDGGIFSFGDATFYGSTGGIVLNKPVVGMAATPDGAGYWLVASDGGVFNYGDAAFYGSAGNLTLNKPVVGMAASPSGKGYWLVATDGGIFSYGDAPFYGSTGAIVLNKPVVGMAG